MCYSCKQNKLLILTMDGLNIFIKVDYLSDLNKYLFFWAEMIYSLWNSKLLLGVKLQCLLATKRWAAKEEWRVLLLLRLLVQENCGLRKKLLINFHCFVKK